MTSRELHAHYRAVRARLTGTGAEAAPVAQATPATRTDDPSWRGELIEFNETLRALFACGGASSAPRAGEHDIWRVVAQHFGISVAELLGHNRIHAWPRHVAIFICLRVMGESPATVGRRLARDHTTILYAARKVRARIAADTALAAEIERLAAECEPLA